MLLNGWSSSPSDGFSPATTPGMWDRLKAATGRTKQAEQQVGMYGWSDDLRRHTTLVFDREQLMRADRLTGVPPALEAIKRISSPSLAPVVPGGGMQPDFQAYEIWVADLLGL